MRTAHHRIVAVMVWLCVTAVSSICAAKSPRQFLDQDAGIVVSVHPQTLFRAIAKLKQAGGGIGFGMSALERTAERAKLRWTSLVGYTSAGFAVNQPTLVQLGAIDITKVRSIYKHLSGKRAWSSKLLRTTNKTFWRTRIVIPVSDMSRARTSLLALENTGFELRPVTRANGERLAMMLGARPVEAKKIVSTLRKKKIFALGWVQSWGAYVVLRDYKHVAVVDIIASFAGVPLEWLRNRRALFAALGIGRRQSSVGAATPPPELFDDPTSRIWIWTTPTAVLERFEAAALSSRLVALVDGKPTIAHVDCKTALKAAGVGVLRDASVAIEIDGATRVTATFGTTVNLKEALPLASDPSPNLANLNHAVLAVQTHFRSLLGIRSLTHPAMFRENPRVVLNQLGRCPGAATTALAFRWPEFAAGFMHQFHAELGDDQKLLDSIGPISLAARNVGPRRQPMIAILETQVRDGYIEGVRSFLANLFGSHRLATDGHHSFTLWGTGPLRAFERTLDGKTHVGVGYGETSMGWYMPQAAPANAISRAAISAIHGTANLSRLRAQTRTHGLLAAVTGMFSRVSAQLRLTSKTIVVTANFQ